MTLSVCKVTKMSTISFSGVRPTLINVFKPFNLSMVKKTDFEDNILANFAKYTNS